MARFGFIGIGNMGGAIASAVANVVAPEEILVAAKHPERAAAFAETLGCTAVSNEAAAENAKFVVLGVIFFLMVAFNFYLKQYTLLYTGSSGVVYGAGFSDIHITLWVYRIIMVLGIVAAILYKLVELLDKVIQKHILHSI